MKKRSLTAFLLITAIISLSSCKSVENVKDEVILEQKMPVVKVTSYTKSLSDLGLMTEIYGKSAVKIMSQPIGDNTGASGATGGEIPRDITEMIKSSLNAIGGAVTYIPYDPAFIQNNAATGYSSFEGKLIPDIVVSGGITEFDRALLTTGSSKDAGFDATIGSSSVVSTNVGFKSGNEDKYSISKITLDFNLVNFKTMAGIPRTNITNSIEVQKGSKDKEVGISLFGLSFGSKGMARKVEGRHAAVRLLVEASMIQLIGKYQILPYWKLLGEGAVADESVISVFEKKFSRLSERDKIYGVQEWLYLHGYEVPQSGIMDSATSEALHRFDGSGNSASISTETALKLYMGIPVTNEAYTRRAKLEALNNAAPSAEQQKPAGQQSSVPTQAQHSQKQQQTPKAQKSTTSSGTKGGGGIGRVLTDEEW